MHIVPVPFPEQRIYTCYWHVLLKPACDAMLKPCALCLRSFLIGAVTNANLHVLLVSFDDEPNSSFFAFQSLRLRSFLNNCRWAQQHVVCSECVLLTYFTCLSVHVPHVAGTIILMALTTN